MANLFAGLLKQAQPAINAGNNVLQDLGILRPQSVNLNDIKRVAQLKADYATKELPKQVEKYKKTTDLTFQNINKILDNADDISESEKENLRKLAQQKQKSLLQATQAKAVQKQDLALTGVAPEKINQFGVKKAQIDIKKQVGQPLNTQEQTIDTFSNPIISYGAGLIEKTAQFGKDLNTGLDSVMSYQDQAIRSVPIIGQGIKALDNLKINQINQDLSKDISAGKRVDLLKRKSQLEATPEIQRQAIKADYQNPNFIKNAQNKILGSKELAEGMRQQGGYKVGEFAGEILPFLGGGEVTGAAKLATGATKQLMKTGIGKAVAKYGGKETAEVLTKGVIENAILEQVPGLIQEGAKVAGGEQTFGQAVQNQLGRTALAAGLGGVADLGIHNVGKALKPTFDKLGRAKKFKEVTAQRQAVQGERQARDADSVVPPNRNQVVLDLKDKLADKRMSIDDHLAEVGGEKLLLSERSQKRVAKLEKEANEIELAIRKYEGTEQTNLKGLNAKQKAQALADQIKANQQTKTPLDAQATPPNKIDDLIPFDLSNVKEGKKLKQELKQDIKNRPKKGSPEALIEEAIKQNKAFNAQFNDTLTNQAPSLQPQNKAISEIPKVEGLKGSGKQIDEDLSTQEGKIAYGRRVYKTELDDMQNRLNKAKKESEKYTDSTKWGEIKKIQKKYEEQGLSGQEAFEKAQDDYYDLSYKANQKYKDLYKEADNLQDRLTKKIEEVPKPKPVKTEDVKKSFLDKYTKLSKKEKQIAIKQDDKTFLDSIQKRLDYEKSEKIKLQNNKLSVRNFLTKEIGETPSFEQARDYINNSFEGKKQFNLLGALDEEELLTTKITRTIDELNNLKTQIEAKKEAEFSKSTPEPQGLKATKNPTIEESQTVPKLGTKKVINPDGTERIARTLGDYKAVEFQEIARQPDKLNKLSDISEAVSKTDEEAIDVIADLAKEKKTFENTLVDLSEALEIKLKQKGIDPETYSYKGIQLFPTKGKDSLSLNTKGQKILNRYERMLDRLGLGERVAKSDVNSLSVQTNIGKASNAKVGAQNSIDDLAEQWIKTKGDLLKSDKQFKTAKDVFMAKTGSKLDNGGLDHVWKNEKGDTAFHISRAKSEFKGEAQELLTARREQLKQRQDTGRTIKGKMETKLKDAETGKAITAASKKFKTVYQELQERLENKTAENLATERSPNLTNNTNQATEFLLKDASENKALDTDLIDEATTNTKKLNKQFAFNPAAIPVIGVIAKKIIEGNGFADTLELALNILPINKAFDKLTKNAKLANMKTAALELVFNTPKTIDQNILSVKRQANQKFIDGFNKLEARKMLYETKLADKSEDVYKEIQDILNNKNVDEILDAEGNIRPEFENSKAAEALAELADRNREMVEYAEDFKDDLVEKINSFNTKIDKLENQPKTASVKRAIEELKNEKFDLEKTLIAVDNKIGALKTITGNGLFQNIQSMAYKGALLWNPGSAFLNLFDYINVRSAPELQASKGLGRLANAIPFFGDVDKALYQTLGQKLQSNKNSLLHFMTADKRGSYYNVMSNASQSRKAGKNVGEWLKNSWQKIEDLDPNKLIAHFYHDVTVVASARSWKAEHPEFKNLPDPVTNFRAFRDKAPKEVVLSFMTKMNIDLGLIAGRGSKGADFALGGLGNTELGKAFTPFLKPVYRISNSLQRASTDMLDGLNGFKKLDNGTYQFDINKVDSDKALKGISSLIANIGGTYLVGGSTALVGLPAAGMAMNFLVRNFVPEEEREDFKDKFNQASLANKKLLPGFGERLQIQQRGFGEKDSIVGMLTNRFKTLGQPLLASYIQDIGKVTNMTFEAFKGEEEVDKEKLLKVWLKVLPTGQLFNKVNAYLNEQEKKVYDLDGAFPKEIGSVKTKGDLRLVVGGGNEEIENIKQSDRLKQRAKSNIQNLNFTGRPGYVTPKFTTEGLKRFRADIDRYMKLNPTADRNEVESKLIAQAKKKWLDKHPELKKPTKQKKYKSLVYSMEEE
jgi:hypothetical protein